MIYPMWLQIAAIPFCWEVFTATPQGSTFLYSNFAAGSAAPVQLPDQVPTAESNANADAKQHATGQPLFVKPYCFLKEVQALYRTHLAPIFLCS